MFAGLRPTARRCGAWSSLATWCSTSGRNWVLSFMAVRAGAGRVYAVDPNPVIEIAQEVATANGLADRIAFIQADAQTVVPPEQVDCLIGDVRGALPILGDNLDLWERVRRRWLRPEGKTIPLGDDLFVAVVAAPKAHERAARLGVPRLRPAMTSFVSSPRTRRSSVRFYSGEVVSSAQRFCCPGATRRRTQKVPARASIRGERRRHHHRPRRLVLGDARRGCLLRYFARVGDHDLWPGILPLEQTETRAPRRGRHGRFRGTSDIVPYDSEVAHRNPLDRPQLGREPLHIPGRSAGPQPSVIDGRDPISVIVDRGCPGSSGSERRRR